MSGPTGKKGPIKAENDVKVRERGPLNINERNKHFTFFLLCLGLRGLNPGLTKALGQCGFSLIFFQHWFYIVLQIVISAPFFAVLATYFVLPESPRCP